MGWKLFWKHKKDENFCNMNLFDLIDQSKLKFKNLKGFTTKSLHFLLTKNIWSGKSYLNYQTTFSYFCFTLLTWSSWGRSNKSKVVAAYQFTAAFILVRISNFKIHAIESANFHFNAIASNCKEKYWLQLYCDNVLQTTH